ncbi:MAG TPA: hypothetical protein VHO29_19370 [Marmoricola sp.]|nr:hypothetical protein [Marmoricola sp.]
MHSSVTAFSGRRGRLVRRATAALLATGLAATPLTLAAATSGAAASPGAASHDGSYGVTIKLTPETAQQLTDGRNYVVATGAAAEREWGDDVVLSFPLRSAGRDSHAGTIRLAGGVAYTGAGPDVRWTRLRVDTGTRVISARVNGGGRAAILRVHDRTGYRDSWGDSSPSLVLTRAGARSLNRAAAGSPFRAGDVFAGDSTGCGG